MINRVTSSFGIGQNLVNKQNAPKKEQEIQDVSQKQESKASKIAKEIADGSYQLDMKKTANAILDTLV